MPPLFSQKLRKKSLNLNIFFFIHQMHFLIYSYCICEKAQYYKGIHTFAFIQIVKIFFKNPRKSHKKLRKVKNLGVEINIPSTEFGFWWIFWQITVFLKIHVNVCIIHKWIKLKKWYSQFLIIRNFCSEIICEIRTYSNNPQTTSI